MMLFLVTVGQQFGVVSRLAIESWQITIVILFSPELSTLFPCVDNRNNPIFEGEIYINIEQ